MKYSNIFLVTQWHRSSACTKNYECPLLTEVRTWQRHKRFEVVDYARKSSGDLIWRASFQTGQRGSKHGLGPKVARDIMSLPGPFIMMGKRKMIIASLPPSWTTKMANEKPLFTLRKNWWVSSFPRFTGKKMGQTPFLPWNGQLPSIDRLQLFPDNSLQWCSNHRKREHYFGKNHCVFLYFYSYSCF